MNERIKLLAEQAGLKVNTDGEIGPAYFGSVDAGYRKFAELIVKECIECADIVGKANLATAYPNSTAHHVKQKIREHFGVEE